jgi:hypothetical protein
MSTNSTINILNEDGTVDSIYCHWDGYLENNGKLLQEFYNTEAKVRELLAPGDLSTLGTTVGSKHDFEDRGVTSCKYYGRDRGESNVEMQTLGSVDMIKNCQEFNYLFRDGSWTVNIRTSNLWIGLRRAITNKINLEVA